MFRTLRAQIFLVMLVIAFINAVISITLFFVINRFIIDNTYIPLMINRYSTIVREHYATGKNDATLPDSITYIENQYGPFLYNTILVTTATGTVVYPADQLHHSIDPTRFSQRYALYLDDDTLMYLFPSTSFSDYPPIRGFTGYTIGLVITILLCTSAVSAGIGGALLFQIYRSISQLMQLLRQHNSDTYFVTQLMPSIPLETQVLAQALDERNTEIRRQIFIHRQLIADVAHELRNPLNTINGYIEAMRDGDLAPTIPRLAIVHDEIQALHRLINDMHLLSLAEVNQISLHITATDACTFANNVYQLMQPICHTHHISLALDCTQPAIALHIDSGRMTRVLNNLIDNAIRHTPQDGTITLKVRHNTTHVTFTVIDSGDGIAPDDIPHIFERFYRGARPQGDGTGLGLAIAKAIVEAHHGSIQLHSTLHHGTTITVTLPHTVTTD